MSNKNTLLGVSPMKQRMLLLLRMRMQWMGKFVEWTWRMAKVIGLNMAKPVFVPITQREPSLLNEMVFIGIEGGVLCIYYAFMFLIITYYKILIILIHI